MQDEQPDRTVTADERLLDVADSVASGSDVDWAFASTAQKATTSSCSNSSS